MTFDFSSVDITNIKPEEMSFGTELQDCALIASTFERGAHSIPSEAATFAVLSRPIQNIKTFSGAASTSLTGYLQQPEASSSDAVAASTNLGIADVGESVTTQHILQAINLGDSDNPTLNNDNFGDSLLSFLRDCIPCNLRLFAFMEMFPNIDFLGALQADLLSKLQQLADIGKLLTNFDSYGDFCELLGLLSFMCIPDLQRLIAMLMALFILDIPKFDGLIGLLQALIGPIFAPILMSITSLLDKFSLLVTSPVQCIIDAINQQLRKLDFQGQVPNPATSFDDPTAGLKSGLEQLQQMVTEAKLKIQEKLDFYINQVRALLSELNGNGSLYFLLAFRKLKIIRMISFIVALISALTQGHAACSPTGTPARTDEVNNFFDTFLNPNAPFTMWINDLGEVEIDEKVEDFEEVFTTLPNSGNVFQFEGQSVVTESIQEAADTLTSPARAVIPCRLEVSAEDADKVNQWIAELNQA